MVRRVTAVGVLAFALISAPRADAAIILGSPLFVQEDGPVTAQFLVGELAAFTDLLFLADPTNALGTIFNNKTTAVSTEVNLGTFSAGTELIFGLAVLDTGLTFFSGPASRNPDLTPHALVSDDPFADPIPPDFLAFLVGRGLDSDEILVGFEDRHVLDPEFDGDYNDLIFAFKNVGVNQVPEPATLVLLGAGFAGVAARARRRNGRSTR